MSEPSSLLPYGRHLIEDDDIAAVTEVLRGEFLTGGPAVRAFEAALAERVGAKHAVACASGTAALHLAALAAELGPGQVAVVPAVTFLATANAVRYVGAEVVFADVDPDSGLMGPAHLDAALARAGGKAAAVLPVHLNGQCADLSALRDIALRHGLTVIEDACHALGSAYSTGDGDTARIGACRHADLACFSFHPVKTVAMGEGGAITTGDATLAERMSRLRNHGMVRDPAAFSQTERAFDPSGRPNPWYYEMPAPGFNYRASDIHCALGLSQLGKLERFSARRRELAARYDRLLEGLAPAIVPVTRAEGCDPVWHLYAVLVDYRSLSMTRGELMGRLRDRGIGTQVHYLPLHLQPYYRSRHDGQDLPGAERYYERVLSLPLFPGMADGDVDRVVEALIALSGRAAA